MDDPRIAVIGAGSLSTRRIYPNLGAAGAQLVGVCDIDTDKAERNTRRFGGTAYSNYEKMLEDQVPDGVILCIGPEAHAELAPRILALGYPVYTEKPPGPTAAATLEVARAAKRTGRLCTTAFKKRYAECNRRARQWLEGYPEEDRYSISIDYCSAQYRNDSPRTSFLLDFCIHIIDLVGFLFGPAQQVFAFSRNLDAYAVSLRFGSGAVGTLTLACGRSFRIPTEEIEITLRGGNFMTIHNSSCWRITEDEKPVEWREPPTFTSSGDSGNDTGHLAEIVAFLDALKTGISTPSNIEESYRTMVLYEAIRDSARLEEVVEVVYEPV